MTTSSGTPTSRSPLSHSASSPTLAAMGLIATLSSNSVAPLRRPSICRRRSTCLGAAPGSNASTPTHAPAPTSPPSGYRCQAVLEIVLVTLSPLPSQAPDVRTLTYPVSTVVNAAASRAQRQFNRGDPNGQGGNGNDTNRRAPGRDPARRRGRKRRRPNVAPPSGRVDGMAMDAPSWVAPGRDRHADGVAVAASWLCLPTPPTSGATSGDAPRPNTDGPLAGSERPVPFQKRKASLAQKHQTGITPA